jgi:hypothetical protein
MCTRLSAYNNRSAGLRMQTTRAYPRQHHVQQQQQQHKHKTSNGMHQAGRKQGEANGGEGESDDENSQEQEMWATADANPKAHLQDNFELSRTLTFGAFGAVSVTRTSLSFGAFGAVTAPRTSHHKQLSCLTLRVSHRAWIEPGEWLSTSELQSKRSNPNARIWT